MTRRRLLLTAILLFSCTPALASGSGAYFTYGTGSGEWTLDDEFLNLDGDVDITYLSTGFALDTAPRQDKFMNYRLQAGLVLLESEFEDTITFDLEGVSASHTLGFQLHRTDRVKLWAGPQVRTAFHVGDIDQIPNLLWNLGVGGAIGANFHTGERITLGVEAGYVASYYAGLVNETPTLSEIDVTGDGGEAFITLSVLFRSGADRTVPPDTDGDGVPDKIDKCANTPRGARVDVTGCPSDEDNDGVPDGIDKCEKTLAAVLVDDSGCPKDTDEDGVPDGIDKCEKTLAGVLVDDSGCPKDGDEDGVPDGIDKCEKTLAGLPVDDSGCPKDTDEDGVPDGIDKCEKTLAGLPVDDSGCPKDTDEDGVPDGIDKCDDTEVGAAVDATGCPRIMRLRAVSFDFNSDALTPESTGVLDGVARALQDAPDLSVEIGGHTDNVGTDAYNLDLSERRANSVRDYLIERGCDPARLTARGYGSGESVADNQTDEGRARNRRVELKQIE